MRRRPRYPIAGHTLIATAAILAGAALAACSDSAGPAAGSGQVSMAVATRPAAAATGAAASATVPPLTLTDGTNTLVITDVQLVVREIELRRADAIACDSTGAGDSCEELELGPILLDLPLGVGAAHVFSAPVAAGSYNEVEFKIQKPSDGPSIKVTGSYNGQDFTYTSDVDAKQEVELNPPLVTSDAASADLTLLVDLDRWFRDGAGLLVDPATALPGQANANLVTDNIRATFHAFEDEDHDGSDDHGGNGQDDGAGHE
jgi:hypothetical protein